VTDILLLNTINVKHDVKFVVSNSVCFKVVCTFNKELGLLINFGEWIEGKRKYKN